jgi:hypothetical protein
MTFIDPDDAPTRSELAETREDTRDYHDEGPPAELAVVCWLMTDPPCAWDEAEREDKQR